jgi:hypothetical protein
MIVWNGCDVVGGRYDPAADAWTPVTNVNAPTGCFSDKCVVWTGSRMLAWYSTTSMGQYDPVQDVWLPMSPTNGPPFRYDTRCAWTGRYLFLFGGKATEIDSVAAGGRYDPQADAWLPVTSTGAVARHEHTMIWTGGRVVLWGGNLGRFRTNTGARYDPVNDVWAATSVTAQTPTARGEHTAVWTGNEMLVWGGGSASTNFVGGAYTVAVDTDGDGTLDQDDCDPWDETAIEVPSEVDSFGFGAESTELAWTPSSAGSGTVYDLLRGPLDAGPVGSPEEECLAGSIEEATFSDPALPGEGSGYRYLVRARNACGVGTYGDSSAGERVATACP